MAQLCDALHIWVLVSALWPKEAEIRALPIDIPENVDTKKSFTLKPPKDCDGCSTIGILSLG